MKDFLKVGLLVIKNTALKIFYFAKKMIFKI